MEHSQKLVVQPIESEIPVLHKATDESIQFSSIPKDVSYHPTINMSSNKKNRPHPIIDKLTKQLKIILKLAKINGYDNDLRIKGDNDNYVENSDVISLLNDAMSSGKVLKGYNEFIKLLYESGVEPDLIINEKVKYQLMKLYEIKPRKKPKEIYTKSAPSQVRSDPDNAVPVIKRRHGIDEYQLFDEPVNIKFATDKEPINWIFPEKDLSNKDNNWIIPDKNLPVDKDLPDDSDNEW